MKNPNRAKSTGIDNRLEFEIAVDRISYLQVEINDLAAERDRAVQTAQTVNAELIAELEAEKKAKLALCEKFAEEHRTDLLPAKVKSAETPLSRWGFRTGNRTVVLLNKKCSWDAAVSLFKAFKLPRFIRTVEEVDKEAVLRHANDEGKLIEIAVAPATTVNVLADLATIGLKIKQTESFYIEPKVESAEQVKAAS
jgi:phage host-nuclease inhibitor protein Gam